MIWRAGTLRNALEKSNALLLGTAEGILAQVYPE
jgi:hypothetical protein